MRNPANCTTEIALHDQLGKRGTDQLLYTESVFSPWFTRILQWQSQERTAAPAALRKIVAQGTTILLKTGSRLD